MTTPPSSSKYGAGNVIAEKYCLGRKLGEGGMGEVWLAHNETLDIDVAIKLIRGEMASADMADRLLHEARAAARLGHPAIVRINDFGKTDRGDPFIVMELLEGEDLAAALAKRGRLSALKAVRTLLPIAHALTVAHTKGIVHRDLKPENVFLARTDDTQIQPKLVDFGVAKLEKQHTGRLTQSGALLGSPLYMSPEQARGDDVDHRADIWALSVVLYEAMTGRPPFEGKNYNAILYSITANPPTPITDLAVGDAELWTILDRGFQKDPDRRWYSMRDFGEALARWLEDHDIHEDITGASLQATWLQWKRSDELLGASIAPPPDDTPGALPPIPTFGGGPRERVTTIRRPRPSRRPLYAALLLGPLTLAATVILVSRRNAPAGEPPAASAAAVAAPPVVAAAAKANEDPAHERAIEAALDAPEPAPSAKSSSRAPAAGGAARVARPHARGIYTADPYGRKPALKDPFRK